MIAWERDDFHDNMFMCHHEEVWIRDCPAAFAPAKYLRYIDDTFVIFRHKSQIEKKFKMLIVSTNLSILRMRLNRIFR